MDELKNIIESLLFVTDEPLTVDRIRKVVKTADPSTIRKAVQALSEEYEARKGGFTLAEVAGGFQLRSRPASAEPAVITMWPCFKKASAIIRVTSGSSSITRMVAGSFKGLPSFPDGAPGRHRDAPVRWRLSGPAAMAAGPAAKDRFLKV